MKPLLEKILSLFSEKNVFSSNALYACIALVLIPFILILTLFFFNYCEIEELKERVSLIQKKSQSKEAQIKHEEKILAQIQSSHSKYVEETLSSLAFLSTERQKWKVFSEQIEPSHPMKERVAFLDQGNNRLQFTQIEVRKNDLFQEIEEKQKNPIEASEEDLKNLLCFIEGSPIHPHIPKEGAPQILLKSFEIEKKQISGMTDKTYQIQMQFIKREALSK